MQEAPLVGASDLAAVLEDEPELTVEEAQAIAADMLARTVDPPRPIVSARACRCRRRWVFEPNHCCRCGHDLAGGKR